MSALELEGFPEVPRKLTCSERELQAAVIDTARLFGWRVAHFRPAMTKHGWRTAVAGDGAGFPDLVLVRDGVLWIELKVGGNTLSDDQAAWFSALGDAGEECHVWTDSDWFAGLIEARLRRVPVTTNAA